MWLALLTLWCLGFLAYALADDAIAHAGYFCALHQGNKQDTDMWRQIIAYRKAKQFTIIMFLFWWYFALIGFVFSLTVSYRSK